MPFGGNGRGIGVAGVQDGGLGEGQDFFPDAAEKFREVATGKLIVAAASLEDGVAGKGDPLGFGIKNTGIRGMARGMNDAEGAVRAVWKGEKLTFPEIMGVADDDVPAEVVGQVQPGIGQVSLAGFMDMNGEIRFLPDRGDTADVIKMPMGQQDFLDGDPPVPKHAHQGMALGARVDEKSMPGGRIHPQIAVDLDKTPQGYADDAEAGKIGHSGSSSLWICFSWPMVPSWDDGPVLLSCVGAMCKRSACIAG